MEITDGLEIDAPVERLWELTIDVERWPDITPTVTAVEVLDEGPLALGSRARVEQPGQPARVWTVSEYEPLRRFAWSAPVLGSTMTGGHELVPVDGGTRNILRISLEGWSAPVLGPLLRRPIARAIAAENRGFKAAAEAGP